MSGFAHWNEDETSWDGIVVGDRGIYAPGIVESIDISRQAKVDTRTGPGVNGATLTFQGRELAKVSIGMKMWTVRHWERFRLFVAAFELGQNATKLLPRDFLHPALAVRGLRALVVTGLNGPSMPDAQDMVRYTIEALQYAPPPKKNVTNTPAKSQAAVGGFGNALAQQQAGVPSYGNGVIGPPGPPTVVPKP